MGSDSVTFINMTFGKEAATKVVGLEAKIRASMRAVRKENWLEKDESKLFQAAIGGVMLNLYDIEQEFPASAGDSGDLAKLKRAVAGFAKLTAYLEAVEQGLVVELPELHGQLLPLFKWWVETKKEN